MTLTENEVLQVLLACDLHLWNDYLLLLWDLAPRGKRIGQARTSRKTEEVSLDLV